MTQKIVLRTSLGLLTGAAVWGLASKVAHKVLYPAIPVLDSYHDDYIYTSFLSSGLTIETQKELVGIQRKKFRPFDLARNVPGDTASIDGMVLQGTAIIMGGHLQDGGFLDWIQKHIFVHFHANAFHVFAHLPLILEILKDGGQVVAFDYRGYGASVGIASPKSTVEDGLGVLNAVAKLYSGKKIIILAQSLGGPIALRSLIEWNKINPALIKERLAGVVLQGTFTSYQAAAVEFLKLPAFLRWLAPMLLSDAWAPQGHFDDFPEDTPILVYHGEHDHMFSSQFTKNFCKKDLPKHYKLLEKDKDHIWAFDPLDIFNHLRQAI